MLPKQLSLWVSGSVEKGGEMTQPHARAGILKRRPASHLVSGTLNILQKTEQHILCSLEEVVPPHEDRAFQTPLQHPQLSEDR